MFRNFFIILSSAILVFCVLTLSGPASPAEAAGYNHLERRLDFDPADLSLQRVEKVNGKPFIAEILNLHTGEKYEYSVGDFIGPLEVRAITDVQAILRDRLSRKDYVLVVPIDKIERIAEKNYKDDSEICYDTAVLLYKTGDVKSSVNELLKAVEKRPQYEDALFLLAYIYHENKNYKEAYDYYLQIVRLNPRNYKCMYNMAEILASNGKLDEAVFMLNKSLEIKHDYKNALDLLDRVHEEIDTQKKREKTLSESELKKRQKIEDQKNVVAQYAENIKKAEAEIAETKKAHKKTTDLEKELSRLRMLYDNNAKLLEDMLREQTTEKY